MSMYKLLTSPVGNAKTNKSLKKGYYTPILHLAPVNLAGFGNVCPKATHGCAAACLNTAGHGGMFKPNASTNPVQEARKRRTRAFFKHRDAFLVNLARDINKANLYARKHGMKLAVRLNGTSDLNWSKYTIPETNYNIFDLFPTVQFYDYTKVINPKLFKIKNYHLTFSQAESNHADVEKAIKLGMNVAVVFDQVPETYNGRKVVDGDEHDLRFLDPRNCVVGLKAKGRAKKDTSGFVVKLKEDMM